MGVYDGSQPPKVQTVCEGTHHSRNRKENRFFNGKKRFIWVKKWRKARVKVGKREEKRSSFKFFQPIKVEELL